MSSRKCNPGTVTKKHSERAYNSFQIGKISVYILNTVSQKNLRSFKGKKSQVSTILKNLILGSFAQALSEKYDL